MKHINELFICQCHNTEHQLIFQYDTEDDSKDVYASVHLVPEWNLWRRVKMAFKYIFGYRCRFGHFDEFIFKKEDADRLQSVVNYLRSLSPCESFKALAGTIFFYMNYTLITDGAYSSAKDQGGIGVVFLKGDTLILEYSKMYKSVTNNMMEMVAVITGLRAVKRPIESLTIITDSMYVIGCASLGWKRNKNKKLWEAFDKELARVKELCPNVIFKHVKGHNGDKWNEYCDKLAVKASQQI